MKSKDILPVNFHKSFLHGDQTEIARKLSLSVGHVNKIIKRTRSTSNKKLIHGLLEKAKENRQTINN